MMLLKYIVKTDTGYLEKYQTEETTKGNASRFDGIGEIQQYFKDNEYTTDYLDNCIVTIETIMEINYDSEV